MNKHMANIALVKRWWWLRISVTWNEIVEYCLLSKFVSFHRRNEGGIETMPEPKASYQVSIQHEKKLITHVNGDLVWDIGTKIVIGTNIVDFPLNQLQADRVAIIGFASFHFFPSYTSKNAIRTVSELVWI